MPSVREKKNARRSMGSPASKGFDMATWAKGYRSSNSQVCRTCAEHPEVLPQIETYLRTVAEAKVKESHEALRRVLAEHFGYKLGIGALKNHIKHLRGAR